DAWLRVREAAGRAGLRWERAVAAFRQGQALLPDASARQDAAEALREAHTLATELGAVPLREEVESLARSARIPLAAVDVTPAPVDAAALPGPDDDATNGLLTQREREVLRHLMAGRTNGEI